MRVCALFAIDFDKSCEKMRPTTATAHNKQKQILCSHIYIYRYSSIIWVIIVDNLIDSFNQIAVWNKIGRRRFYWSSFICLSIYSQNHTSTHAQLNRSKDRWEEDEEIFLDWHFAMRFVIFSVSFHFAFADCYYFGKLYAIHLHDSSSLALIIHYVDPHTFSAIFEGPPKRITNQTKDVNRNVTCSHQYKSKQFRIIFYVNFFFSFLFCWWWWWWWGGCQS